MSIFEVRTRQFNQKKVSFSFVIYFGEVHDGLIELVLLKANQGEHQNVFNAHFTHFLQDGLELEQG